jgi:hypothetical protein
MDDDRQTEEDAHTATPIIEHAPQKRRETDTLAIRSKGFLASSCTFTNGRRRNAKHTNYCNGVCMSPTKRKKMVRGSTHERRIPAIALEATKPLSRSPFLLLQEQQVTKGKRMPGRNVWISRRWRNTGNTCATRRLRNEWQYFPGAGATRRLWLCQR